MLGYHEAKSPSYVFVQADNAPDKQSDLQMQLLS